MMTHPSLSGADYCTNQLICNGADICKPAGTCQSRLISHGTHYDILPFRFLGLICLEKICKSKPEEIEETYKDNCSICFLPLHTSPVIMLGCRHLFHFNCVKKKLDLTYTTSFISFEFAQCPLCKEPIFHKSLADICDKIRFLESTVKQAALKRLRYESRDKDEKLSDPKSKWFKYYKLKIFVILLL